MHKLVFLARTVGTLAFISFVSPHIAAQQWEPAHLAVEDPDRFLLGEIRFPRNAQEGPVVARCIAEIDTSDGRLRNHRCFPGSDISTSDFNAYDRALERAISGTRAVPAKVNGTTEVVRMNFSVVFNKQGEDETLQAFHNHLYMASEKGVEYSAAQRIIRAPWQLDGCSRANTDYAIQVAVDVDAEGKASNARRLSGNTIGACESNLVEMLNAHSYIPAIGVDGIPFASTYVELFTGSGRGGAGIGPGR